MGIVSRQHLHQATQYLKQLKVQLIEKLPHQGQYGLHYTNHSISTGVLNNTTEIKIDLPSRTFSYYHNEFGEIVDLLADNASSAIRELITSKDLELPPIDFPAIPEQEFIEFQRYADTASAHIEQFRMSLEGHYTFNFLWGHNFDFSVVVYFDDSQIDVGISPGDETSEQPYFYIVPRPVPDSYEQITIPVGQWWNEGWTGIMVGWDIVQELDHAVTTIRKLYDIVKDNMGVTVNNNPLIS